MNRFITLLSILFLITGNLSARHIIGGEMTYDCLGNGDYEITMYVYRDCLCSNCATLDREAQIAIYECGTDINCSGLNQSSPIYRFQASLLAVDLIDPPSFECLIPPNVCVQRGFYQFKLSDYGISLPASQESYHIVYQRCCRNVTITNLNRPDNQGVTYTTEITPEAQSSCNNSPVFNDFPPTVICAGQPLNLDQSATDPDGDILVYEFCSPLNGGGSILGGSDYNSCEGALPSPPCPPPYNGVNFISPTYTGQRPLGGNPIVTIDPVTGIITGTPINQGQYVVGICVTEIRDGMVIGKTFRDFQFNVANCDPTVVAKIEADEIIDQNNFVVRSCGDLTITLENESYLQRYIDDYRWEFIINGATNTFSEWNPEITFPGLGDYSGQLFLNPGSICGDTANIIVRIFPAIESDFSFEYDTCVSGPVVFTDESFSGSGVLTDWLWNFGDNNVSTDQNPEHLYRIAGSLPVELRVKDINDCVDETTKIINYFPVPDLIVISPSTALGCQPLDVFFDNLSYPINNSYQITWDFGDGGISNDISPSYTYEDAGLFSVGVEIISPIGCMTDTSFSDLILVEGSPVAQFDYNPKVLNSFNKTVNFIDQSESTIKWNWDFEESGVSSIPNPTVTYPDTGMQRVQLIVTHPSGCKDTAIVFLDIIPEVRYFLPNAFTPNNDAKNEVFKGVGVMDGARDFNMSIWNRWGEKIFETSDPQEGWNGQKFNDGRIAPNGVYVVLVSFIGPRGERFSYQTNATLLR